MARLPQDKIRLLQFLQQRSPNLMANQNLRRFVMSRPTDSDRLDAIRDTIQENPNRRPSWIARKLKLDNKTITRALPQLEARGDMLAEDKGRLSWFGKRRSK